MKKIPTLTTYLNKYIKIQENISLCYRPTLEAGWGQRCMFLDEKYSPRLPYNHRSILDNEIVIEFDNEKTQNNLINAEKVTKKLIKHKIAYSLWSSGNKSFHVHCFINADVPNVSMFKKAFMRFMTQGLDDRPDMQLAVNHLIRAEYGVHENTGKYKTRLRESAKYPLLCDAPQEVWDLYVKEKQSLVKRKMTNATQDISESEIVKQLLDTTYIVDTLGDGRERIVFALSNVLCIKYTQPELEDLLWSWYKYSGGRKLDERAVKYKVYRAYKKRYNITDYYLKDLLADITPRDKSNKITQEKEDIK